jgi:hypothetical protein
MQKAPEAMPPGPSSNRRETPYEGTLAAGTRGAGGRPEPGGLGLHGWERDST